MTKATQTMPRFDWLVDTLSAYLRPKALNDKAWGPGYGLYHRLYPQISALRVPFGGVSDFRP